MLKKILKNQRWAFARSFADISEHWSLVQRGARSGHWLLHGLLLLLLLLGAVAGRSCCVRRCCSAAVQGRVPCSVLPFVRRDPGPLLKTSDFSGGGGGGGGFFALRARGAARRFSRSSLLLFGLVINP